MTTVSTTLQFLSVASLAVYAGTMLTEGFVLVPYWRSAPPEEFFSWYAANGPRLAAFFGGVTWIAGLLAIAAAIAAITAGQEGRWASVVAAALMVLAVSSFFVYFERANAGFSSRLPSAAELPAELARWASWHWARTAASLGAVVAALVALAHGR